MATLAPIVLAAALLAGTPDFSQNDGPPNLGQAQAFTIVATVLGAATACDGISHDRVSAAARQVGALATAQAVSADDVVSVERLLMVSATAGRQAVEKGLTDCATVEGAFSELEQVVMQTPA